MAVETATLEISTRGNGHVLDITAAVEDVVQRAELAHGTVTIFCPSSTSALTTIEYESGAVSDLQRLFDEVADPDQHYAHNARWGDGNGHSHVRAALLGPSLTIPFIDKQMTLGTWQQIVYLDFDNRQRQRRLVLQLIGD